jgi:hypothetical protein
MAIALDTSTQLEESTTATESWSHTCSGTDRILLVAVFPANFSTLTGVTYNGVAMTLIASHTDIFLYKLIAPATGANNIEVTASANRWSAIAASFTGCDQEQNPIVQTTGTSSGPTQPSTDITTITPNEMVVDIIAAAIEKTIAVDGSQTLIEALSYDVGNSSGGMSYETVASPGTVSMDWTGVGNARTWYQVVVSLKESPGSSYDFIGSYEHIGSSDTVPITLSAVDIGTRTNGLLVAKVMLVDNLDFTFGAATWNGDAMSQASSYVRTPVSGVYHGVAIYYLANPDNGSNVFELAMTMPEADQVVSMVYVILEWYNGAAQTSVLDQVNTGDGTTDPSTSVTPTLNNELIVDAYLSEANDVLAPTILQIKTQDYDNGGRVAGGSFFIQGTAAAKAMSWTGADDKWTQVVASFKQLSSATNVSVNAGVQTITSSQPSPSVTATVSKTVSPGVQTTTLSQQNPTITVESSVQINADIQTATLSQNSPTVSVTKDVTISPNVQVAIGSQVDPTITTTKNVIASPNVQAITSSQNNPSVTTTSSVTVSPEVQVITVSQENVMISVGDSVSPSQQDLALTLNSPTVTAIQNRTTSPNTQVATFSLIDPEVTATVDIQLLPEAILATFGQNNPVVTAFKNIITSPEVQAITFNQESIAITVGDGISPSVQELTLTQNSPTIIATQNEIVSSSVQMGSFSLNEPEIITSTNVVTSPNVQTFTFLQNTPTIITTKNLVVSPNVQTGTLVLNDLSVATDSNVTVNTNVQTGTLTLNYPTVIAIQNVAISPDVQTATFGQDDPSIVTAGNVTVSPSVQSLSFSQNSLALDIDETLSVNVQNLELVQISPAITGDANISTDTQVLTSSQNSPNISVGEGLLVDAQQLVLSTNDPTVITTKDVTASPDVQTATFNQDDPSISTGTDTVVSVGVQTGTFTLSDTSTSGDANVYPNCLTVGQLPLIYNEQLRPLYRIARDIYLTL